jgi:hypothetical protein
MEQKKQILKRLEQFTEEERLQLFNVEELETRLEMSAVAGEAGTNGSCNDGSCQNVSCNSGCWA